MSTQQGWIGVDLDGTLAEYDGWRGIEHIGNPIPLMLERIKVWLSENREVRIFTARAFRTMSEDPEIQAEGALAVAYIKKWLVQTCGLPVLDVTCVKDFGMVELWDDRAVQVIPNTGKRADGAG